MSFLILHKKTISGFSSRVLLSVIVTLASLNVAAAPKLPTLDEIEYIYVLGTFDIPDLQRDVDGIRDRPRLIIWPDNRMPKDSEGKDLNALQIWVVRMLGKDYKTETHERWHNHYHRIADYDTGGIVYKDGTLVGWYLDKGGLGYLDFAYDPIHEKASYWQPKLNIKPKVVTPKESRIYRVPDWSKKKEVTF